MRFLLLAALLLAACAAHGDAPASGIRGAILAGPACPGPARVDSPCPDKPIAMAVEVVSGSTIVATFTSDAAGRFSVGVAPGTYTLRSKSGGPPTLKERSVVVVAGTYTEIELRADTGMR